MKHLSLFSGIGGIDLAAHACGFETIAFVEKEPFTQRVLTARFPGIPIWGDIHEVSADDVRGLFPGQLDLISGGYPCQPFSMAGRRQGAKDDRHLWPEMFRLIRGLRPRYVLGENVRGHLSLGLDEVLVDLGSEGYETRTFVFPASSQGAPHQRYRVFVVGRLMEDSASRECGAGAEISGALSNGPRNRRVDDHTDRSGEARESLAHSADAGLPERRHPGQPSDGTQSEGGLEPLSERCSPMANATGERMEGNGSAGEQVAQTYARQRLPLCDGSGGGSGHGPTEPTLGGTLDGLSSGLDWPADPRKERNWPTLRGQEQFSWEPPRIAIGIKGRVPRLKALGNAVNPAQVYPILRVIAEELSRLQTG